VALAIGCCVGFWLASPAAGIASAAYGGVALLGLRTIAVERSRVRADRLAADVVAALAADLRAGLGVAPAMGTAEDALQEARDVVLPFFGRAPAQSKRSQAAPEAVARRVVAATEVAQRTGAPLADLLDQLDAHLRAIGRLRAQVRSQAAGTRASAALLAAMPGVGVGLGFAIGIDPLRPLLHTMVGGIALCLAVALQLGGLAWTAQLSRIEVPQ